MNDNTLLCSRNKLADMPCSNVRILYYTVSLKERLSKQFHFLLCTNLQRRLNPLINPIYGRSKACLPNNRDTSKRTASFLFSFYFTVSYIIAVTCFKSQHNLGSHKHLNFRPFHTRFRPTNFFFFFILHCCVFSNPDNYPVQYF